MKEANTALMEEEPPPGVESETPNVSTDENPVSDAPVEAPNAEIIPPRSPLKDATPEDGSPTILGRKYRALYEDTRERLGELKKTSSSQREDLERQLSEKDEIIKELNARLLENAGHKPVVMKMNNGDPFVPKPRKNTKGESESNGCEISGCSNINVDLTKCSMCGNLVCEDCSGVKVAKLRPIMNACSKLYFTCPNCDVLVRDTSEVNIYDTLKGKIDTLIEELGNSERENTKLKEDGEKHQRETMQLRDEIVALKTGISEQDLKIKMQAGVIQQLQSKEKENSTTEPGEHDVNIDAKLEAFSAGILSKVTEIMDMKLQQINTSTKTSTDPVNPDVSTPPATWSNVVSQSQNMKTVMREARNDEKIEESEKQRRANNIIIHGADEIGASPDEIKKADDGYIKEIFAKIGVAVTPTTIARLGTPRENGKRPIKLAMKSKEDKEKVMNNLGRLKNTERYFGKISLKDDHTSNEREQIRTLTNETKKKCEENPDRDYKVRGDSKNGWRIVSFLKK